MKKKAIIIGAGPAGLTTAYELLKRSKDYNVIVLEESDSIGGISKTVNYKGNRMDIGGHRFFSKEQRVNDFWQMIMPIQGKPSYDDKILKRDKTLVDGGPDPEKEDNVFLVRNRVSRIYYLKKFFDYPVSMKLQTFKNLGFVRTIQSGFSYLKSIFFKKKEVNLENFYINRFGKKLYSTFFEDYTEKLWGRHPRNISADWGAQRVKGLSIIAVLKDSFLKLFKKKNKTKETSLIEEYIYPKYGPGELWEKVAQEVEKMGGTILKNHQVIKISNEKNKIKDVTCLVNGKEKVIKGDIFISSMPLKDLICNMNKVPKKVYDIANDLPYRDFVTVGVLVKKLNLKNETNIKTLNNIVPDCWIYVQEPNVKLGRIQIFNNWSPYMVEKPKDTVWIGLEYFCNENDNFWNMSDDECKNFAIDELVKMGIIDRNDVLDSHREKVKKAYPAYFDSYSEIDKVIKYVNKYDNLYCIGRNGQHRYNNMDHSMMTGMKTVDCILGNEKNKNEIWNVNTEKEFHEEKSEKKSDSFLDKAKNLISKIKINKWFLLLFVILVPLYWWCSSNWVIDNDSWFLFTHGRYVLENGFPMIEPFTIHENFEFVMQQWLFAIGYYLLYKNFGLPVIFILLICINYIVIYMIYKICMLVSNKNYIISFIASFVIDMILINDLFVTTRPQVITGLLIFLEIYIIEKFMRNGNYKMLFILPIISLIQINIHASMWWFLFIFMLPFIAEGIYENKFLKKKNSYDYRWLIVIGAISFIFGFINPYGIKAIYYFINSYSEVVSLVVREMKPIKIFTFYGALTIGNMFLYFIIYMRTFAEKREVKVSYLLMLFGCTILNFMAKKSFDFFVVFTIYPLCYFGQNLFRNNCVESPTIYPVKFFHIILVSIILIGGCSYCFMLGKKILDNQEEYYLKDGVDKLLEVYPAEDIRIYTNYDVGGYLEYRNIRPYIDPRAEVFYITMNKKAEIFTEYYLLQNSNTNVEEFISDYNFTHLLVVNYDRLFAYDGFKNYEEFYNDDNLYKIYVRKDLVKEKD